MVLEYITPEGRSHLNVVRSDKDGMLLVLGEAIKNKAKIVVNVETGEKYENLKSIFNKLKKLEIDDTCVLCEAGEIHFEH